MRRSCSLSLNFIVMRYFLPFLPFVACAARVFVSDADKERTRVPGTDRVECEKRRRFSDMT